MTAVHVIYTGIVGFVSTMAGMTVVVQQDASTDTYAHVPHVLVEEGAIVGTPDLTEIKPADKEYNGFKAYLLESYQITVEPAAEESTFTEAMNFREFVLNLEAGCPPRSAGCGGIMRAILGGKVPVAPQEDVPPLPWVAARMPLGHGRLATTFVDEWNQWNFERLSGGPKHLAEEVCYTFTIDGEVLTLKFAANNGTLRTLKVKALAERDKEPTIEIRIGNLPAQWIFVPPTSTPETDPHIKLYYDLSALPPSSRRPLVCTPDRTPLKNPPQAKHTHRLTPPPLVSSKPSIASSRDDQNLPTPQAASECDLARMRVEALVRGPNCPPALWSN